MYNHATLYVLTLAMVLAGGVDSAERLAVESAAATRTPPELLALLKARAKQVLSAPRQKVPDGPAPLRELRKLAGAKDAATKAELTKNLLRTQAFTSPLIEWGPDSQCNVFTVHYGVIPLVDPLDGTSGGTFSACNWWCRGRADCGGFLYVNEDAYFDGSDSVCTLYNINYDIVNNHLIDTFFLNTGWLQMTFYGRTCDYDLGGSDLSCNEYDASIYENQRIINENHWITSNDNVVAGLTAQVCQAWCTLYTDCKSVTYQSSDTTLVPDGGRCYLYATTIQDLIDGGNSADVAQDASSTTYDRFCCNAYNP